jgi:hypothetical protein
MDLSPQFREQEPALFTHLLEAAHGGGGEAPYTLVASMDALREAMYDSLKVRVTAPPPCCACYLPFRANLP